MIPEPTAEQPKYDPLSTMDGVEWAKEFMRLFGHRLNEVDEGLMIAWFCNAIMKGWDTAKNREPSELAQLRARVAELEATKGVVGE